MLRGSGPAVLFARLGHLAPPGLVFIIGVVFLVLQPQSVGLFDEGTLLCLREKSENKERDGSARGSKAHPPSTLTAKTSEADGCNTGPDR